MIIPINANEYSSFLKSATFVNITNAQKDEDIKKEFSNITEPAAGWYCTPAFFKKAIKDPTKRIDDKNSHDYLLVHQHADLKETSNKSGSGTKSTAQMFDSKFYNQIIGEKVANQKNVDSYFQFFFPCIIKVDNSTNDFGIINLNIKKLPLNFEFVYTKSGSSILTTPLINDKAFDNDWLTSGLSTVDQTYFDCDYYVIPNQIINATEKSKQFSYSSFLNDYFTDSNNMSKGIYKIKKNMQYDINALTLMRVGNDLKFLNTGEVEYNFLISNVSQDVNNKNIITTNSVIDTDTKGDARLLYYQNCIDNEKTINAEQQTQTKYGSVTVTNNKNQISDYYDISFHCKHLKTFMTSSFTPGYHVLNYTPSEIYKSITMAPDQLHTINIINVYKEIFKRKIIDVELFDVTTN